MATPSILDFYRFAVPRGYNLKHQAAWTTSSSSSAVLTAAAGRVYFVQGMEMFLSMDASLGANTITITHSADTFGGVNSTTFTISSVRQLIASFAPATETFVACNYFGMFLFDVPVLLDPSETLTVAHSGGTGGISAGHIKFGFSGWHIPVGDL